MRPLIVLSSCLSVFFSNYVVVLSPKYDFLEPFYISTNVDEALSTCLKAVSLAFFAHQENAAPATKEGRHHYILALSKVRGAIGSPVTAEKDSTLLATMLRDLYEKVTNLDPEIDHSWKSHVRGSLALVGLRGPQLFQDRNGFRMLFRLSTNILERGVTMNPWKVYAMLGSYAFAA